MNRLLWAEGLLAIAFSWPLCAPAPANAPVAPSDRFDGLILTYSRRRGLDPRLVKAIIAVESQFYTRAVSPAGARGLMQVMPDTAADVGISAARLREADANIAAGTAYLRRLFILARSSYGIPRSAPLPAWLERRVVAAYHGGPRNLFRTAWASSTRDYVRDVFRLARSQTFSRRPRREPDFRNS